MTSREATAPERPALLIVDDTPANLEVLVESLTDAGYDVSVATDGERALERLKHLRPDLILLDVVMPGMDGFETCRRLKSNSESRDIPVIFMTARTDTVDKVTGFAAGAVDYITKPLQHEEVLARVQAHLTIRSLQQRLEDNNRQLQQEVAERRRAEHSLHEMNKRLEQSVAERTADLEAALEEVQQLKDRLHDENVYLQHEIKLSHNFEEIITRSDAFGQVLAELEQVAVTDATVLILGETGTGKELVARAVHSVGGRADRPLVKVNCAALPANLIESELFGHERGAFTGASSRQRGRFELADNGTIFLDELGDLPLELQAKLLRVLQEGEFERVGSSSTIRVDVRVIAATNRDLDGAVAAGDFRQDLYYRLNVFPIRCPPLRDRPEDIPLLVEHFAARFNARAGKRITSVPQKVIAALQAYHWPGNVRELENVVERAVILSRGTQLELGGWLPSGGAGAVGGEPGSGAIATLADREREHIVEVLELTGWRVRGARGAAALLGVKPTTLEARMKRLGIERP